MSLSIETLGDIDWVVGQRCLSQVPVHIKHEVDYNYEVDVQSILIFELRPLRVRAVSADSAMKSPNRFG